MRKDKYIQGFDERLQGLIDEKGWTRKETERRLGLEGKSNIYRYIELHQMPCVSVLVKMANVFNVSTDYLLGLEKGVKK